MAQTTTSTSSFDTTAYNTRAWWPLRAELYFDPMATVGTTPQTHRGASVQFTFNNDLAVATTPLTETADVTPVAMSDSTTTVTLAEYGNVVERTAKLKNTSYIEFDPLVADAVGYNAGITMDTVSRDVLAAGTNVIYSGGAAGRSSVAAANVLSITDVAAVYAALIRGNVRRFSDGLYRGVIHPDVEYSLKTATGETSFNYASVNSQNADPIFGGSIESIRWQGFRWLVSPRAPAFVNGGASSIVDVYRSLFLGQEALAKATSTGTHGDGQQLGAQPLVIASPWVDTLYRFKRMGWYHFVGYSIFRQAAVYAVESASPLANNAS